VAQFFRLVKGWETRAARGETPTFDAYEASPHDYEHTVRFIRDSAAYIRDVCQRHALHPPPPPSLIPPLPPLSPPLPGAFDRS
jgi:hypothetical protein